MAEPYFLTKEDIDRLGLDAMVGEQATATDLEMLNAGVKVVPNNQPVTPLPDGQPQSMPSQSAPRTSTMGGMTSPYPTTQDDPYGNLSKTQRRMLAFGAIHDAGLALQGKAGTMVPALLSDFTDRADQARKAAAARYEFDMRQRLLGSMGLGANAGISMQEMSIEDLQNLQQQVLTAAMTDPDNAQAYKLQLDTITSRIEQLKQEQAGIQDTASGAKTVLNTVGDLAEAVANDATITGPLGMLLGALPFTAAGESRLTLETLKANIAFDSLKNIKAAGGTLGSVSAPELALLEARIASLNLNRRKEAVLQSLKEIDDFYKQIVVNAYNKATSEGLKQLDQMFGGRPEWVNGATPQEIQQFTFDNAPVGGLVYDPEAGKVYKFKGGDDRLDEANWEEVKK